MGCIMAGKLVFSEIVASLVTKPSLGLTPVPCFLGEFRYKDTTAYSFDSLLLNNDVSLEQSFAPNVSGLASTRHRLQQTVHPDGLASLSHSWEASFRCLSLAICRLTVLFLPHPFKFVACRGTCTGLDHYSTAQPGSARSWRTFFAVPVPVALL